MDKAKGNKIVKRRPLNPKQPWKCPFLQMSIDKDIAFPIYIETKFEIIEFFDIRCDIL